MKILKDRTTGKIAIAALALLMLTAGFSPLHRKLISGKAKQRQSFSFIEKFHSRSWSEIISTGEPATTTEHMIMLQSFINCNNLTVLASGKRKFIRSFQKVRKIRNLAWLAEGASIHYHSELGELSKAYRALKRLRKAKHRELSISLWEGELLKSVDSAISRPSNRKIAIKILKEVKISWLSYMKPYNRAYVKYLLWKVSIRETNNKENWISKDELTATVKAYPGAWFSMELVEKGAVDEPLAIALVLVSNGKIEEAKKYIKTLPAGPLKDYLTARVLQKEGRNTEALKLFIRAYPKLPRAYRKKALLFIFRHSRNKVPLLSRMLRMGGKHYRIAYRYILKSIESGENIPIKPLLNYLRTRDRLQLSLIMYVRGNPQFLKNLNDEGARFWKYLIFKGNTDPSPLLFSYYYFALNSHIRNRKPQSILKETAGAFQRAGLKRVKLPKSVQLLAATGKYRLARKLMKKLSIDTDDHIYSLGKSLQKYMWYREAIMAGYLLLKRKGYTQETLSLIYPLGFINQINYTIEKYKLKNVPPSLALSLIWGESHFDRWAVSRAGALGLTQLMPSLAKRYIKNINTQDILDPENNLYIGLKHLDDLMKKYNLFEALAAYNAGERRLKRWKKTLYRYARKLPYPELAFVEFIPFDETRNYVKKLYRTFQIYKLILMD